MQVELNHCRVQELVVHVNTGRVTFKFHLLDSRFIGKHALVAVKCYSIIK